MTTADDRNPLARAESRLGSARVTAGRFRDRRQELADLHARLERSMPELDAPVPLMRSVAFRSYLAAAQELRAFYDAVFTLDDESVHRPSLESEHDLSLHLSRFTQTLDPLADDAFERSLHGVRLEWRTARQIGELSARQYFASHATHQLQAVETLLGELDNESSFRAPLENLHEFLETQRTHWDVLVQGIRQELLFMYDTQGRHGEGQALAQIRNIDIAFGSVSQIVLASVDPTLTVSLLSGPGESLLAQQHHELSALRDEFEAGAAVERAAQRWVAQREADVVEARRHVSSTLEVIEIDNISADLEYDEHPIIDRTAGVAVFVVAHPDDETTALAEAIANAHAKGMFVVLAIATGGEAGRVQSRAFDTPAGHRNFVDDRFEHMQRSAAILGVDVVVNLGAVDSGMTNEPSSHDLRLASGDNLAVVTHRLTEVLDTYQPVLVGTHPPHEQQEAYGHDDHGLTYDAVLEATRRHVESNRAHPNLTVLAASVEPGQPGVQTLLTDKRIARRGIDARRSYENQIPPDAPANAMEPTDKQTDWVVVVQRNATPFVGTQAGLVAVEQTIGW